MSAENSNPEQAQAKIAVALGRLRGDVMPPITSQAAPRLAADPVIMPPSPSLRPGARFACGPHRQPERLHPAMSKGRPA